MKLKVFRLQNFWFWGYNVEAFIDNICTVTDNSHSIGKENQDVNKTVWRKY